MLSPTPSVSSAVSPLGFASSAERAEALDAPGPFVGGTLPGQHLPPEPAFVTPFVTHNLQWVSLEGCRGFPINLLVVEETLCERRLNSPAKGKEKAHPYNHFKKHLGAIASRRIATIM